MSKENSLPPWARHALIGVGLFLAGGLLAFTYSYRPLHGALSWQIDQLESRLDERNLENVRLSDALAKQKFIERTQIDPNTFAQVERELEQTKRVLDRAEKNLKRANRKRKESVRNATKWRKRFEELRDAAAPVAATAPKPIENLASAAPISRTPPAAPAPSSSAPKAAAPSRESQPTFERGILLPSEPGGPTAP